MEWWVAVLVGGWATWVGWRRFGRWRIGRRWARLAESLGFDGPTRERGALRLQGNVRGLSVTVRTDWRRVTVHGTHPNGVLSWMRVGPVEGVSWGRGRTTRVMSGDAVFDERVAVVGEAYRVLAWLTGRRRVLLGNLMGAGEARIEGGTLEVVLGARPADVWAIEADVRSMVTAVGRLLERALPVVEGLERNAVSDPSGPVRRRNVEALEKLAPESAALRRLKGGHGRLSLVTVDGVGGELSLDRGGGAVSLLDE